MIYRSADPQTLHNLPIIGRTETQLSGRSGTNLDAGKISTHAMLNTKSYIECHNYTRQRHWLNSQSYKRTRREAKMF